MVSEGIERLRAESARLNSVDTREAIDEIERLRAEQRVLELMVDNAIDEIKRLRADRDKWEKLAQKRNPHSWRNLVRKRYGMEDMYER